MPVRKRSRVRGAGGTTTVIVGGGGGGQGVTLDHGVETERDAFSLTQTRDLGAETEAMGFTPQPLLTTGTETESFLFSNSLTMLSGTETETDAIVPQPLLSTGTETETQGFSAAIALDEGTETEADAIRLTGNATFPQGTETETDAFPSITQTWATGTETESHSASAVANLTQYTTTATATQNSGTTNWTNPTNAQGAINGTEAQISYAPTTETQTDATLKCTGLVIPTTPSGFARTNATIRIKHRWDLTITAPVAGVTDAINTIELRSSADALISTLNTRSAAGGGGTQASLLQEDYDITALVSDAQLNAGIKVWCNANYDFLVASGNASWQVDAVHLIGTFTRSGIT